MLLKIIPRLIILFLICLSLQEVATAQKKLIVHRQGIIRGDTSQRQLAIVFTGDLFADGGDLILKTLKKKQIKASFFFTGNFYRNPAFRSLIRKLKAEDHYLGAHSDKHLLYCDWTKRDSLLVTKQQFESDLLANYREMEKFGIGKNDARYFLPPYEWYNDSIAIWTKALGFKLINFSPGTLSHADYTTPDAKNYRTSDTIFHSITACEQKTTNGLNGFIVLLHVGTAPKRTDKFYYRLAELVDYLTAKGYKLVKVNELLE